MRRHEGGVHVVGGVLHRRKPVDVHALRQHDDAARVLPGRPPHPHAALREALDLTASLRHAAVLKVVHRVAVSRLLGDRADGSRLEGLAFSEDLLGIGLRDARCEHAGGPLAGNGQRAAGAFPAPHCQDDSFCRIFDQAVAGGDCHDPRGRDGEHRRISNVRDLHALHVVYITLRVFRAAERHAELGKAESVVNALAQYTSEVLFPFHDQNIADPTVPQPGCGSEACRSSADDQGVYIASLDHFATSLPVTELPAPEGHPAAEALSALEAFPAATPAAGSQPSSSRTFPKNGCPPFLI